MTEQGWLECNNPDGMLQHLGRRVSRRKLRLFGCACYPHVPRLWADERVQVAVTVSERYADGDATKQELAHALTAAILPMSTLAKMAYPTPKCAESARRLTTRAASDGAAERLYQATLLRDLFGNPFHRPISISPVSLGPLVLGLAQAAYENRIMPCGILGVLRLAVLADALEDTGWTNPVILEHLRGPGPHVRGCWVVDSLLGKK
jgi:hypothetical protein